MQVTPLPVAPVPPALPQDGAKVVPQVQAQAAAPIVQRAIDPSPRSENGNQTRSNSEKAKGGTTGGGNRGGSVNIRV